VYEQSLYPVAEFIFKHPLTQEVALASQLQERRKRLHAAVARVIEAAHAKDLDQQAALLAHHWEEAADLRQAVQWDRRAAEWAGARDPVEGVPHWRKVRDLGHSLDDEDVKESRLRACGVILGGSWRLGMSEDEVRGCLGEARSLAKDLGRPSAAALPLAGSANHPGMLGRAEAALALTQEAKGMLNDGMDRGESFFVEVAHGTGSRSPDAFRKRSRRSIASSGSVAEIRKWAASCTASARWSWQRLTRRIYWQGRAASTSVGRAWNAPSGSRASTVRKRTSDSRFCSPAFARITPAVLPGCPSRTFAGNAWRRWKLARRSAAAIRKYMLHTPSRPPIL